MKGYFYIATPYSHPEPEVRDKRFNQALEITTQFIKAGVPVLSTIVHCHPVAVGYDMPVDFEFWKDLDESLIDGSLGVIFCQFEGSDESKGMLAESKYAIKTGKPVIYVSFDDGLVISKPIIIVHGYLEFCADMTWHSVEEFSEFLKRSDAIELLSNETCDLDHDRNFTQPLLDNRREFSAADQEALRNVINSQLKEPEFEKCTREVDHFHVCDCCDCEYQGKEFFEEPCVSCKAIDDDPEFCYFKQKFTAADKEALNKVIESSSKEPEFEKCIIKIDNHFDEHLCSDCLHEDRQECEQPCFDCCNIGNGKYCYFKQKSE